MSVMLIPVILHRIKAAEPRSPIAVFLTENGRLDAMFGATVDTLGRIIASGPDLVGVFDRTMDISSIRKRLRKVSPASLEMENAIPSRRRKKNKRQTA